MKKLASLILALAMCLALGAPAFAGETSMTGNLSTELSSQLPTLNLTLPEAATIILNPYRSAVSDSVASAATGIDKGDRLQVMNAVFSITSKTLSKVHVSAVVTGSTGGNTEFSSTAVASGAEGHKVNLTLTYALASGTSATVPSPDKVTGATNVKTISDTEQTLVWDIPAATSSGATATQRVDMQFGGTCSDSPTAEEGPWTEGDTVSASFVFTATPVTDDPMISVVYQAKLPNVVTDFVQTVTPPADFKKLPTGSSGITKIEYADPGTAAASFTDLSKGSDNWDGSNWATTGKTITLKSSQIATVLPAATSATATAASYRIVKFYMEYEDDKGVAHETTYTFKVTVLVPLASGA